MLKNIIPPKAKILVFLTINHITAIRKDSTDSFPEVKIWIEGSSKSNSFIALFSKKKSKRTKKEIGTISLSSLNLFVSDVDKVKEDSPLSKEISFEGIKLNSKGRDLVKEQIKLLPGSISVTEENREIMKKVLFSERIFDIYLHDSSGDFLVLPRSTDVIFNNVSKTPFHEMTYANFR